jgi:hypothetical protein
VIGYPSNILAWIAARNVLFDIGRVFQQRIAFFTAAFTLFTLGGFLLIFAVLIWPSAFDVIEQIFILATFGLVSLILALSVILQMLWGLRVNRSTAFHKRRLARLESVVQAYIVAPPTPLPAGTIERLKRARKLLSLAIKVVDSEAALHPLRVMGLPATTTVLTSLVSVSVTGLVAAISAASSSAFATNESLAAATSSVLPIGAP